MYIISRNIKILSFSLIVLGLLGIPSYADRDITEGSIYHVLMHGINLMGSHAGQVDDYERWQIAQYVLKLREDLIK